LSHKENYFRRVEELGMNLKGRAFSLWEKVAEGRMSNFRQQDCLVSKEELEKGPITPKG
jgi:hypothetical protein